MSPPITQKTPVRLPLSVWLWAMGAAVAAGAAINQLRTENATNRHAIEQVQVQVNAQGAEQKVMREVLIRIDENVKIIKRTNP